jgi:putative Holliday junction resolvase
MRILAIDHGDARCGLAISDATGTIVRPLETLPPDVEAIAAVIAEEGAQGVVVGLPLSLDGEEGDQAAIVRAFGDELAGAIAVPVDLFDERLTTAMAAGSRRAGACAAEDSLAAAHLLESYLVARENSAPQGRPGDLA